MNQHLFVIAKKSYILSAVDYTYREFDAFDADQIVHWYRTAAIGHDKENQLFIYMILPLQSLCGFSG